ncbi:hypothetical protein D0866_14157 [Hortaea werneckii]|uniref:Heterokaryon incompatibility domain-containing protein n=1 Tax=Hortaea werneckii TaxID=91943 RepID=A0A3M6ZCF6_HORWE|nr:hypothetical protein D0866_14157 [Hortaea werneckii]
MSIAMLPRTYRQAVYLARQLGINHVWIDALCIVQDDNEDWQRESSRMAEIYSGAYIVFVAAAAADVEGGLDISADLKDWRHLTEHQVRAGSMWVRFKDHKSDVCAFLPISTRAWTYQERRLAKRCLIFGESEVVWECRRGCRCPCFGAQTVLTRPTDRLPAISAIATVIQAVTGDKYLAGLWRSGLLLQLAWRPDGNWSRQDSPYGVYVAPSWSWASFPGAALLMHAGQVEFQAENAEILHVSCEPANLCSPLGAVHHGTLTLRGFCVWVNVQHLGGNSPAHFDKLSIISNEFEFHVALRLDYSLKTGDRFQDLLPERLSEAHVMPRARVEKRGVPEMPVQLLYLTRNIFLVLSSSTRKHGAYFRTGILSLSEDLVNRDEANKTNVRKQLLSAANREEVVVV